MTEKPQIYIETSVISYLTARPSRDVLTLSRQQLTNLWWNERLSQFSPVISKTVLDEATQGDSEAAARRLAALDGIPILGNSEEIDLLAQKLIADGGIPRKAEEDAEHLAVCAVHRIPYLVTWNFKHISNKEMWERLKFTCERAQHLFPVIFQPVI